MKCLRQVKSVLFLFTLILIFTAVKDGEVAAQQCVPQPNGLISWWQGEGNANDNVGNNHGTLGGGATFGTGMVGQAFQLDGIDDYVAIPDSQSLDFNAAVTIQAWVYIYDFPTGGWPNANMQVLQKTGTVHAHAYALVVLGEQGGYNGWGPPQPKKFGLELTIDGLWSGDISPAGGTWSNTQLQENTWHHLAATYDGNQIKLYLDGQPDGSHVITGSIETNDVPVRIGNWGVANADHFNGLIDEVQVYNTALSGSEIMAIYNAGSAGLCEAPILDIKANGSDGPVELTLGDTLSVTVELDPGNYPGYQADWWCVADTPWGWYYYDAGTEEWLPGFKVSYQGPLGEVSPPLEVLNTSDLPIGGYTFYFGVDGNRNGNLDDPLYYDSVEVNITP